MTAPSEPVRPADEETVQALAEALRQAHSPVTIGSSKRVICHCGFDSTGDDDAALRHRAESMLPALREVVLAEATRLADLSLHQTAWIEALLERDEVKTAVVASEPWQRLVRERDEARAAVARVEALLDSLDADEFIDRAFVSTKAIRAALRGDAEEASDG